MKCLGAIDGLVVKLFLIDLAGTETLARTVSFLGVGLVLLVVATAELKHTLRTWSVDEVSNFIENTACLCCIM